MIHRYRHALIDFAVRRPKVVTWAMVLSLLVPVALVALGTFQPRTFPFLQPVRIDTDPENMLAHDEPVRLYHDRMKEAFDIKDIVVVGVVNETHPQGVFNVDTLGRVHELTEFARTLQWADPAHPERREGVVAQDLLAPGTVDNIEQGGLGVVSFSWLMPEAPTTQAEALAVRDRALRLPFLKGTLVSEDGKALALYLPLTSKDVSYQVREKLLAKIASWPETGEDYHITGLPVAEDTFGVEMFIQMAVSAPLAMFVIVVMMWLFFRKWQLILSPVIVAIVTSTTVMALLVATGNTIHIMSSMIPIFVMPIAVLDAIHILSEFFDRYQDTQNRRTTIVHVMESLFMPMLFTTLTTAAGFASLALTPIPPVQVFGLFVALGVLLAWLWTVMFIPAFVMFIPERSLANFGHVAGHDAEEASALSRALVALGHGTRRHAKAVMALTAVAVAVAAVGISRIQINDNPIKWFTPSHPIRVADRVLNDHFGGTYMAYLALEPGANAEGGATQPVADYLPALRDRLAARAAQAAVEGVAQSGPVFAALERKAQEIATGADATPPAHKGALLAALVDYATDRMDAAPDAQWEAWDNALLFLDTERQRDELFKRPETLSYLLDLQAHLDTQATVGKTNSVADLVRTVHRELFLGDEAAYRVPDTQNAVAQTLITYQNSHRPHDLWHFVTPDYRQANIWVQLTSGDNQDMASVEQALAAYTAANPPPFGLEARWFGMTHINVVWQEKMVTGMLEAFLGSFLVVLLMMIILFRSALWGALSMVPLTVAVALIYGIIGLVGKDYDMPVAVLSSLSLGLAVDYAIHFLARAREFHREEGSWEGALTRVFGEPARAISRNAIVLGVGFLPLLIAPLVPYQTVGIFITAILLAAGAVTLVVLPATMTLLGSRVFARERLLGESRRVGTCVAALVTLVALVTVNLLPFVDMPWFELAAPAAVALMGLLLSCAVMRWLRPGLFRPTMADEGGD